jgi:hypothetical protein
LAFIDRSCLDDADDDDNFTVLRSHNRDYGLLTFQELPERARAYLLETRLPVVVLPAGILDVEILRIFQRLNSTGLKLNAQEHRNADYSGEFKDLSYALAYAQHQRWLSWQLFNSEKIARMLEVEFTSDVLGLLLEGVKARRKATIDKLYKDYDEALGEQEALASRFADTCDLVDKVFGLERSPASLRRFRTSAWLYSCFAVFSNADLLDMQGRRRRGAEAEPLAVTPEELVVALQRIDSLLRSDGLDEAMLKTLRGATSDRTSRQRRIQFIRDQV